MTPAQFQAETNVSRETMNDLQIYRETLLRWQKKINLVSNTTLDDIWKRHFLDSFQLYDCWKKQLETTAHKQNRQNMPEFCWIDMGSGAGFPGMVLAILLGHDPDLANRTQVHLVESIRKKTAFLSDVKRLTNTNVNIHTCRIEQLDLTLDKNICKIFTARALASLDLLCEYMFPMSDKHSEAWFLKGHLVDHELKTIADRWMFELQQYPGRAHPEGRLLHIRHLEKKTGGRKE